MGAARGASSGATRCLLRGVQAPGQALPGSLTSPRGLGVGGFPASFLILLWLKERVSEEQGWRGKGHRALGRRCPPGPGHLLGTAKGRQ